MKVTVVGGGGIVGSAIVEHMKHLGHEVAVVEQGGKPTFDEAVRDSDVTFIVTRPIRKVGALLEKAAQIMRPGSLLVHGTSVQSPCEMDMDWDEITRAEVTICHFHFHFKPMKPLRNTLRGQHITLSISGANAGKWKDWLLDSFASGQAFIHEFEPNEHDKVTVISQLVHMITAFLVGSIWQEVPSSVLEKGLTIGGPPARFLTRLALRTASGSGVAAEILECHPQTRELITQLGSALGKLDELVEHGETGSIEETIAASRELVPLTDLTAWDERTAQLIRLEADLQRSTVEFNFPAEMNQPGLLARVLGEFDRRGVDKTTTIAQTNPDGSCTFVIGVREDSPAVAEAAKAIKSWTV